MGSTSAQTGNRPVGERMTPWCSW